VSYKVQVAQNELALWTMVELTGRSELSKFISSVKWLLVVFECQNIKLHVNF